MSLMASMFRLRSSIDWAIFIYVFCANAFFLVSPPPSPPLARQANKRKTAAFPPLRHPPRPHRRQRARLRLDEQRGDGEPFPKGEEDPVFVRDRGVAACEHVGALQGVTRRGERR